MPSLSEDEFNLIRKILMDLRSIKTADLEQGIGNYEPEVYPLR